MSATMFMLVAVLAFSLYPLIMIYGMPMGVSLFLLTALAFSTIIAFIVQWVYLRKKTMAKAAMSSYFANAGFDDYLFLGIIGFTTVLTHIFFLMSLELMSKVGASIIYESWPIFSMFLAPLIIRKAWKYRLRIHDYFGALLAGLGIVLISLSDQGHELEGYNSLAEIFYSLDVYSLIGAILALMGGIMLALFVNFRTEFSNRLQKSSEHLNDTMTVCIIGEFICRAASLPFLILAVVFIPEDGTTTLTTVLAALI